MKNTALLLIDAQVNMFTPDSVYNADNILDTLQSVLSKARAAGVAIIHVQHNGGPGDPDEPNSLGWAIHPQLCPTNDESVIQKKTPDAFHNTNLQNRLRALQIDKLVIGGMQTDYCINATSRKAAALGYSVMVVADGHSTYAADAEAAEHLISQYNHDLAAVVNVTLSENIQFES